jgi:hypothetical protein
MTITRRRVLSSLAMIGAANAFRTAASPARSAADPAADWQWLVGNWDVWHERLRGRLEGSTTWDEFSGRSNCWLTLGGLGTIDDNLLHLPAGTYRAVGVRAFDPDTRHWAIWWLDGRIAGKLDPPVRGSFNGSEGEFQGPDVHKGRPVTVRFRWHDIHSRRPHWDQAYSPDAGATWEINWRNYFTRTSATPTPLPLDRGEIVAAEAADWRFLVGHWKVRNRRRTPAGSWEEFDSTLHNWPVMGGLGNVSDNLFHDPGGTWRGMSVRAFDAEARLWRSWWLDGRQPRDIAPALAGRFTGDVGTLVGEADVAGSNVRTRSRWTRSAGGKPQWEQARSSDGQRWDTHWTAEFERQP